MIRLGAALVPLIMTLAACSNAAIRADTDTPRTTAPLRHHTHHGRQTAPVRADASTAPGVSAPPTAPAPTTPTPTPPTPTTPAIPPCSSSTGFTGTPSSSGPFKEADGNWTFTTEIKLTNRTGSTCLLGGWPKVVLRGNSIGNCVPAGAPVCRPTITDKNTVLHPAPVPTGKSGPTFAVKPGQYVVFQLLWRGVYCDDNAYRADVSLPGDPTHPLDVVFGDPGDGPCVGMADDLPPYTVKVTAFGSLVQTVTSPSKSP